MVHLSCYSWNPALSVTGIYSPMLTSRSALKRLISSGWCLGTHASHQRLLVLQGGSSEASPAFIIRLLTPAPSRRPKTVNKNSVTTSWSLGESRWKHLASTSPSFPVAVSGFVSPSEAPAQIGKFWFKHHCFVHDKHGWDGLSGMSKCNME